jgi:hypothetical protein
MSIIISPIITNAGLSVFTPSATGIEFTFTHVAVGTGTSVASAANTALENEIARFPIAGGGMVTGGQAVSINGLITNHANANPQNYDITELGFYGVDSNSNTVLFAIYRTNTTIIRKVSGADISVPFILGLAALPVNNMTVQIDTNTSAMLALLGQHTASSHPHTQYKRTLDNTERLKIATAVDADEAIRKDELDALRLRLIANGIDADLVVTNNATGLDFNDNQFKVAGVWYFDNAINTSTLNTAGIITVKQVGNKAFQHEILDNGQAANRVFTGIQWLPWVYQTGAVQGVVTFIPIDDYTDLNNFNTEGYFTFSTSDNVGHAPPTEGLESDYELQVLVTPSSGTIQIAKNITTNASFVRLKGVIGGWTPVWTLTPPIQHIVTNANMNSIRSEGVYLCIGTGNTNRPNFFISRDVFILYVKNSETLQTVVQVANRVVGVDDTFTNYGGNIQTRALVDSAMIGADFGDWSGYPNNEVITGLFNYFLSTAKTERLYNYLDSLNVASGGLPNMESFLEIYERKGRFILRNYDLNNAIYKGIYVFTLNDNITNIPSVFTDENHFFFLWVFSDDTLVGNQDLFQVILQGHSANISSEVYVRHQPVADWQNHVTPPAWVIVP